MARIQVREYHPESGALLDNVSTLQFSKVSSGTHSRVKVIDVAFTDVTVVGSIKLGLIANGGLVVNVSPTDLAADGSAGNGNFGIESSSVFDETTASAPLSRHFAGSNSDITAANTNNVDIGNRSDTVSDYVYLDVEVGAASSSGVNGAYKVFFDFS